MENKSIWKRFESHMFNEGVTKSRIMKLKTMFNMAERGLNKPYNQLTRNDIENFIERLHRNQFKRVDGSNLSGSTKSDLKRFLKQFFKWYKGKGEFFPKEVVWIRIKISKDEAPEEKPIVSVKEIIKIANHFKRVEMRILTLLLFDSGFRISEMLSVTKEDISWEDYSEGNKCFWINCNESKTEKRKVPVPLFTEDIQSFFNSAYFKGLGKNDLVFKLSYDNYRNSLKNASRKTVGKIVTPHALRHSSATYYAKEFDGNSMMLADRYGWTYSSSQLKTYIRRSGAYQKIGAQKVYSNEVLKVKEENAKLKEDFEEIKKQMQNILIQQNKV